MIFGSTSFTRQLLFAMGYCALLAGCGGPTAIPCAAVQGTVLQNGQPLPEAMVVFHPQGDQAVAAPRPIAYTNAQGEFSLTTIKQGDGAPLGKYAITVELREPRLVGEEQVRDGRNLLPPRYANPQTSPLSFDVAEGKNEVPPITIER
jgi:hypothetical protein